MSTRSCSGPAPTGKGPRAAGQCKSVGHGEQGRVKTGKAHYFQHPEQYKRTVDHCNDDDGGLKEGGGREKSEGQKE